MRLVVHVGMPKTGSTALQAALAAARGKLRKRRILYPRGALNQNFLVAGLSPPDRLGRLLTQKYEGDEERVNADFQALMASLISEIAETKPDVTVLSGEFLFGPIASQGPEALRALIAPLNGSFEIVCYVRRPSDYYVARAQQRLKASWQLPPAGAVRYRPTLESALAAAETVHALPFDRERFPGGDVVADFVAGVLPEAEGVLHSVDHPKVKPSMSAEAMAIVQDFRRERYPDANDRFTRDTGHLARHLAEREGDLGGQRRPRPLPALARLVDQSSTDLLWLRDRFGIVFAGVDYASIAVQPSVQPTDVADICLIDGARKAALLATMKDITWPEGDTAGKGFRAAPKAGTRRRQTAGTDAAAKTARRPRGFLDFLRRR